jgi:hypothetical protein
VAAAVINRHEKVGEIGAAALAGGVAICGLVVYPFAKKFCAADR